MLLFTKVLVCLVEIYRPYGRNGKDGASIVGWQGSWDDGTSLGHQHWTFEPQSLRGNEVHTTLLANPYLRQDFKSYVADGMWVPLSSSENPMTDLAILGTSS